MKKMKKKYAGFQVATDNGTTEFAATYREALTIFGMYDSATIYAQPIDESMPLIVMISK